MALNITQILSTLSSAPNTTQGPTLLLIIWLLLSLSTLTVLLRCLIKVLLTHKLFLDDILMICAVVFALVHASLIHVAVQNGFGKHIIYVGWEKLPMCMKVGSLSLFFGTGGPMFGRISFACTLLYLTATSPSATLRKIWPRIIWTAIIMQVVVNGVGIILFYCQCGKDLDVFWTLAKQIRYDEFCWDPVIQTNYGYFMGILNTLTDVWLAILPAVLVHRTKMRLRRKIGVAGLLCLGLWASVASGVKTVEAGNLSKVTDYTYSLSTYVIAMAVELNIVIITASIPCLRPLFRKSLWKKLLRKRHSSSSNPSRSATPASITRPGRRGGGGGGRRSLSGLPSLHQLPPWRTKHIPLSSGFTSKNGSGTNLTAVTSNTNQGEETELSCVEGWCDGDVREVDGVITVTTEVEISYQSMEKPFVHASIVGLIQGEIANPRLRKV